MGNEARPGGVQDPGPFFHGTKADLRAGDQLKPGYSSNFGERRKANFVYLTANLGAATWGTELAVGDGPGAQDHIGWPFRRLMRQALHQRREGAMTSRQATTATPSVVSPDGTRDAARPT